MRCVGFSSCGARALECMDLVVEACGLSCSMWDLSSLTGIEPMFPALADGLLTTVPPGRSLTEHFDNRKRSDEKIV